MKEVMNYKNIFDQDTLLLYAIYFVLMAYNVAVVTKYKVFYIYSVLVFAVLFIKYAKDKKINHSILKNNWMIIGLFFSFYLSTIWAYKPDKTFEASFWATIFLVVYFIFYYFVKEYHYKDVKKLYILLPIFISVVNCIILFKNGKIRGIGGSYSNIMAGLVEVSLPFVIWEIKFNPKKATPYLFLVLVVLNILISESRGSVAILFCATFLIPVFYTDNIKDFSKYLGYCICTLAVFFFLVVSIPYTQKYYQRIYSRIEKGVKTFDVGRVLSAKEVMIQKGDSRRMIQYHMGWNTIKKYPYLGIGYGSYRHLMERNYDVEQGKIPHNVIFTVWTGSGLVGLFLFLGFIIKTFNNFRKEYRLFKGKDKKYAFWIKANVFALILLLLHGQFRPLLINPIFYLPLATGMALSLTARSNNARIQKKRAG